MLLQEGKLSADLSMFSHTNYRLQLKEIRSLKKFLQVLKVINVTRAESGTTRLIVPEVVQHYFFPLR